MKRGWMIKLSNSLLGICLGSRAPAAELFHTVGKPRLMVLYLLLKALLAQAPGCKLFAVGDDWQSIYCFAGSDIDVFTCFLDHFCKTAKKYLTETVRSNLGITHPFAMTRSPDFLAAYDEDREQQLNQNRSMHRCTVQDLSRPK